MPSGYHRFPVKRKKIKGGEQRNNNSLVVENTTVTSADCGCGLAAVANTLTGGGDTNVVVVVVWHLCRYSPNFDHSLATTKKKTTATQQLRRKNWKKEAVKGAERIIDGVVINFDRL